MNESITPPRIQLDVTREELNTLCAGLGKLRKRIVDRIKSNSRFRNLDEHRDAKVKADAAVRHLNHNRARLVEVDALLNKLNEINQ